MRRRFIASFSGITTALLIMVTVSLPLSGRDVARHINLVTLRQLVIRVTRAHLTGRPDTVQRRRISVLSTHSNTVKLFKLAVVSRVSARKNCTRLWKVSRHDGYPHDFRSPPTTKGVEMTQVPTPDAGSVDFRARNRPRRELLNAQVIVRCLALPLPLTSLSPTEVVRTAGCVDSS